MKFLMDLFSGRVYTKTDNMMIDQDGDVFTKVGNDYVGNDGTLITKIDSDYLNTKTGMMSSFGDPFSKDDA
jgi:hypothetical protein